MKFNKEKQWEQIIKDLTPQGKQSVRTRILKGQTPMDHLTRFQWIQYFKCEPPTIDTLRAALWHYRNKFANAGLLAKRAASLAKFLKYYFEENSYEYRLANRLARRLKFIARHASNRHEIVKPSVGRPVKTKNKVQFPQQEARQRGYNKNVR